MIELVAVYPGLSGYPYDTRTVNALGLLAEEDQ